MPDGESGEEGQKQVRPTLSSDCLNKVLVKLVEEDAGIGLLAIRVIVQKLCSRLGKNVVTDVGLRSVSSSLELSFGRCES